MRVLVTGASGFSGSFVASALVKQGHEVVGLQRRDTQFSISAQHSGVHMLRSDLAGVVSIRGPFEAIVHAAATSPAPGIDVDTMVQDNVNGTRSLIEAALNWQAKSFVLLSSVSVNGDINCAVLDETCPIVNPTIYGVTKHLAELMLADCSRKLPGLALRLPGVIGPGADRNWLSRMIKKLQAGERIAAFNLDQPFNNAAHVGDVAALVARVLSRSWTAFDSVVLGARGMLTIREVLQRLAHGLNVTATIETIPVEKSSFVISSNRAIERWGYEPMEIGCMLDRYVAEVRLAHAY
jgi:nucleoside-diphosphate-sugar epimerase